MTKTRVIHVRLTDDELAALDQRAERSGLKRSEFARRAILEPAPITGDAGLMDGPARVIDNGLGRCRHPVGRRIGNSCAECGARIGGRG